MRFFFLFFFLTSTSILHGGQLDAFLSLEVIYIYEKISSKDKGLACGALLDAFLSLGVGYMEGGLKSAPLDFHSLVLSALNFNGLLTVDFVLRFQSNSE